MFARSIFTILVLLFFSFNTASASKLQLPTWGRVSAPVGWVGFCIEHKEECKARSASHVVKMEMNATREMQLWTINWFVNMTVRPLSDLEQYTVIEKWTYPDSGKGDCEDYALLKKRRLEGLGWSPEVLLITLVDDEKGEGHAVLLIRTSRGDLILDNKRNEILLWSQLPYTFRSRQSTTNQNAWVSLVPLKKKAKTASVK